MRPRAALLLSLALLVISASPLAQAQSPDPRLVEAQGRIDRGERLFEAGDYSGALAEFQAVQAALRGHPAQHLVSYNIGQCYEQLFRYDQAVEAYRRYLTAAPPAAPDRPQVVARLAELEGLLATIHLSVNVSDYEVWLDDRNLGQVAAASVPGGVHMIEVRARGHRPARQEVTAASRTTQTLAFALEQGEEGFRGLNRGLFWASAGLALASLATGALLGGLALAEHNDLERQLADEDQGWLVTQEQIDDVEALGLGADILFGLGGLFATAALVLAFFTDWGHRDGRDGAWLTPSGGSGRAGLILGGTF